MRLVLSRSGIFGRAALFSPALHSSCISRSCRGAHAGRGRTQAGGARRPGALPPSQSLCPGRIFCPCSPGCPNSPGCPRRSSQGQGSCGGNAGGFGMAAPPRFPPRTVCPGPSAPDRLRRTFGPRVSGHPIFGHPIFGHRKFRPEPTCHPLHRPRASPQNRGPLDAEPNGAGPGAPLSDGACICSPARRLSGEQRRTQKRAGRSHEKGPACADPSGSYAGQDGCIAGARFWQPAQTRPARTQDTPFSLRKEAMT